MKNKKALNLIKRIFIIAIIGYFAILVLPWLFVSCSFLISPSPKKPEVRYGEFPFEVVFEQNGEAETVKDIYVCEYDGIGVSSNGKFIKWKGYIKNTKYDYIVLEDFGNIKLICSVGNPEYYMNDNTTNIQQSAPQPVLSVLDTSNGAQDTENIEEDYGIRIIGYKFSRPITNTFK